MGKKLILIAIVCLCVFESAFSFAETPPPEVCSAPSAGMVLYQNFQDEMKAALLGGEFGQQIFAADISVRGLFTDKVLFLPAPKNPALDLIVTSMWRNIQRLGTASLTTFVLLQLAQFSVVSSNLQGLAILYQDRVIVREWRSLLQIDTAISQIAYYLGKTVNILSSLPKMDRIEEIFADYQGQGLFSGSCGSGMKNVPYITLLREMAKMNAAMKWFVSAGGTWPLSNYVANELAKNRCVFDPEFISQLDEDYSEVRSFSPCNATFSALKSTIKNGFSSTASAFGDAKKIIVSASKRLAEAFSKTFAPSKKKNSTLAGEYFSERELQMLRTMYGLDTSRFTNRDLPRRKRLINLTPAAKTQLLSTAGKTVSLVDQTWSGIKSAGTGAVGYLKKGKQTYNNNKQLLASPAEKLKADKKKIEDLTTSELQSLLMGLPYNENFDRNLDTDFGATFQDVFKLYDQSSQDFIAAEVTSRSPIFYSLVDQVTQIEENITHKTSGLLYLLGKVCEQQCGNKGNKGCRPS